MTGALLALGCVEGTDLAFLAGTVSTGADKLTIRFRFAILYKVIVCDVVRGVERAQNLIIFLETALACNRGKNGSDRSGRCYFRLHLEVFSLTNFDHQF